MSNKKMLKKVLKNQGIIDSKLNALLERGGMDPSQFKTVNPTVKPPPPPNTGG